MQIELDPARPPETPVWPAGIVIRSVADDADERRLCAASEEAFSGPWSYVPRTFEQWVGRKRRHGYDPGLWIMALDGDEVAGLVVGGRFPERCGRIHTVAVQRPWRRRGLALALLRESFRRFVERGMEIVTLSVDAASATGATRLYQKAGMWATRELVVYDKELRPGVDPGQAENE
jgi:ribosomal protein S18 acetylase RimI-like enzyme